MGLDTLAFCEKVIFMTTQNTPTARISQDWRHQFRQHALDLDPGLGYDSGAGLSVAPPEHWLLREAPLRSIIASVAADLRELGRWTGTPQGDDSLLLAAIQRIGVASAAKPAGAGAWLAFIVRFVWASVCTVGRIQREIAAVQQLLRPRAPHAS
jgi:hypothetical protein